MIDKKDMVIKTDARRFIPFAKDNVLKKLDSKFQLRDTELRMRAASGFYPLIAGLIEAIYDKESYTNGKTLYRVATGEGYQQLIDDEIDVFFSTGPSRHQKELLRLSGFEYEFTPLVKEPIAILLNTDNPVDDLTVEQLQDMYFGKIVNWNEVGGKDGIITTYQLVAGNGSQTCFESIVIDNPIDGNHQEVVTMPAIIDNVAWNPNGICYAFTSYYTKMYAHACTKIIKLDGYSVWDTKYPLQNNLYMIYKKNNSDPSIKELEKWLTSIDGLKLIQKANEVVRDYGEDY